MNKRLKYIILIIILLSTFQINADKLNILPEINETANPDHPCFGISMLGGKLHGIFGTTIPFYTDKTNDLKFTLAMPAFVELHNYSSAEPVPWELWRGFVGLNSYWEIPQLTKSLSIFDKIIGEIGLMHESDHATDLKGYVKDYTTHALTDDFDNANFSSYEYINIKMNLFANFVPKTSKLALLAGAKLFTRSSKRSFTFGYNFEGIYKEMISNGFHYYISAYYESINNNFSSTNSNYQILRDNEPLTYFYLQFGLQFLVLDSYKMQIFTYNSISNGRGLDFVDYNSEIGFGIKFIIFE